MKSLFFFVFVLVFLLSPNRGVLKAAVLESCILQVDVHEFVEGGKVGKTIRGRPIFAIAKVTKTEEDGGHTADFCRNLKGQKLSLEVSSLAKAIIQDQNMKAKLSYQLVNGFNAYEDDTSTTWKMLKVE